jgi:hypothetical protein
MTANTVRRFYRCVNTVEPCPTQQCLLFLGGEQRRRAIKESEVFTFLSSIKSSVSGSDGFM